MTPVDTPIDPDGGDPCEWSEISALDPITHVPDVRDSRFGERAGGGASAAIRQRVLRKHGAEVPVAAFQSYI